MTNNKPWQVVWSGFEYRMDEREKADIDEFINEFTSIKAR